MNILVKTIFSILGGLTIFVLTGATLSASHRFSYTGKIYPGVSVAGVDVSGLTEAEAAEKLRAALDFPQTGRIAFQDGPTVWVATPLELGFVLDTASSTGQAVEIGRSIDPFFALTSQFRPTTVDLPAKFIFDERVAQAYLETLAATIHVPTVEASLGLEGSEVIVHSGQVGRELDVPALNVGGMDLLDRYEARIAQEDPFLQTAEDMSFFVHGDGAFLKLDQDGRITVNAFIREHTGIASEVAFVGRGQFFQIWEPGQLEAYRAEARQRLLGLRLATPGMRPAGDTE